MAAAPGSSLSARAAACALYCHQGSAYLTATPPMRRAATKVAALVLAAACSALAGRDFEQASPCGHGRQREIQAPSAQVLQS